MYFWILSTLSIFYSFFTFFLFTLKRTQMEKSVLTLLLTSLHHRLAIFIISFLFFFFAIQFWWVCGFRYVFFFVMFGALSQYVVIIFSAMYLCKFCAFTQKTIFKFLVRYVFFFFILNAGCSDFIAVAQVRMTNSVENCLESHLFCHHRRCRSVSAEQFFFRRHDFKTRYTIHNLISPKNGFDPYTNDKRAFN